MLEQLYTPKVIVTLMALILAVNGMLLYQLWGDPPGIQAAETPSSSESPQIPNLPPQDGRNGEAGDGEAGEEAPLEDGSPAGDEADGQEELAQAPPNVEGSQQGGQSSGAGVPGGQSEPPGTPFESQYDPPPTIPGGAAGGGGTELASSELGDSGDFDPGVSGSSAGGGQPESGLARIQTVVLSAFYEVEGSSDPGSEASVLPATSGFGVFTVALSIAAMAAGVTIVALRSQ